MTQAVPLRVWISIASCAHVINVLFNQELHLFTIAHSLGIHEHDVSMTIIHTVLEVFRDYGYFSCFILRPLGLGGGVDGAVPMSHVDYKKL